MSGKSTLSTAYWTAALLAFAGAVGLVFGWTPEEKTMGVVQKVFYMHMPVAVCALAACLVTFVGSVGFIATRKTGWDDLASAAAAVAVVLCTGVLLTGMIWGRVSWGQWWTWGSTRLTFSFMLWVLYVVYLVVRSSIEGSQRRAMVSAVYGIVAFLDVPLVYLSATMIPDTIHPPRISLSPSMKLTLAACFVPVIMVAGGLIAAQYRVNRLRRAARDARLAEDAGDVPVAAGGAA